MEEICKIVSISDAVTESFLKVFPDLKDKIVVIENILPEQLIYKQMDEFDVSEEMFSEGVKFTVNWKILLCKKL